jgi:hypothetical protein
MRVILSVFAGCPLYPQKRTCALQLAMSAMGHKRTFAKKSQSRMITTGRRFGKTYFVIAFINPSTIWSMLKLAGRWLGG